MSIRYTIENTEQIAPGVWNAPLSPADVRGLGQPRVAEGGCSLIGIKNPLLSKHDQTLSFLPTDVLVFSVGHRPNALLVEIDGDPKLASAETRAPDQTATRLGMGDENFVRACKSLLHPDVAAIGEMLLIKVRVHQDGELQEAQHRKWVNRPKNFFTITPQSRNQAYRISLRGRRSTFAVKNLKVLNGLNGYSEFILKNRSDLSEAVDLILQAAKN